jgi:hypothetical protein
MVLSHNTLTTYNSLLNSLAKDLNYDMEFGMYPDGWKWLENINDIWQVIKLKTDSVFSQSTIVFAIKNLLEIQNAPQELINEYGEIGKSCRGKIMENYATQKKSKRQIENWVSIDELNEICDNLELSVPKKIVNENDYRSLIKYLVLKCHLDVPLRRDLTNCKIFLNPYECDISDKSYNYIVLNSTTLTAKYIGNYFKTSKYYGEITFEWSRNLSRYLFFYYDTLIKFSKSHLFIVDYNDNEFSKTNFTKFLNSIFKPYKKRISTSLLRNIIITDFYKTKEIEKEQFAYKCGHSVNCAYNIYNKIN